MKMKYVYQISGLVVLLFFVGSLLYLGIKQDFVQRNCFNVCEVKGYVGSRVSRVDSDVCLCYDKIEKVIGGFGK